MHPSVSFQITFLSLSVALIEENFSPHIISAASARIGYVV